MKRAASLGRFFAGAIAWFLALTVLWLQVSAWTSYPVAGITHVVLEHGARDWIRKVHKTPGKLEADTRIVVSVPGQSPENSRAEVVIEVDPSHYAYGLPLFLALLLASRSRHLVRRSLAGYVVLLIPQSFSLTLEALRQVMVAGGSPLALGVAAWQMEAIALGYQFGSLLLPTLAPVALWLCFEKEFLEAAIATDRMQGATEK